VAALEGPVAPCESVAEIYAREGYKAVGTLLRSFLDKLQITPPELLHFAPYLRKLNDNYSLVQGALHQVAQSQTKDAGGDYKPRYAKLLAFADAIERRAREAAGERKLPVLEGNDLARLWARVEARLGEKDALFWCNVAIARALQASPGAFAKLEVALYWLEVPLEEPLRTIADNYVACALDNPTVIKDLLGHRPNLAAALTGIADLAAGTLPGPPPADSRLPILAAELGRGGLRLAAHSLWERVLREAARGRPLAKDEPRREWTTLMKLNDRLVAACPAGMKEAMRLAFRQRVKRLHQADVA
jgi:hypothetical protein